MNKLVLALLLPQSGFAADAEAQAEPLVHPDLLHNTIGLFQDAYAAAYEKAGVAAMLEKVPVDDVKKVVMDQAKGVPPEVTKAISDSHIMLTQAHGTAYEFVSQAFETADAKAKVAVHQIESLLPHTKKGMIKASLGGLALFALWMTLAVYLQLQVLKFVLKMVFNLTWLFWCGICCCRLCRGKKTAATGGKKKGGVAEKGKVAAATSKTTAKAQAKKK